MKASKTKQKLATLNAERRLYANLYVACQSREGDLDNFFSHENHSFPVSISEYGKLRKAIAKSDFIECLESKVEVKYEAPNVAMKIIDGAAFVNMNRPKTATTYGSFYKDELISQLKVACRNVERLDVVFDIYKEKSLKNETRESRGEGIRISIRKDMYNKTELFKMLAETAVTEISKESATVVATLGSGVVSNDTNLNTSSIAPCNHEEADTRVFLHALDGANNGFKKMSIVTVDTDVVVIAIQHFAALKLEELWIEFGVGKSRKYIPIHDCARIFGERICSSISFWHSFTGCDTVSTFNGKGKKTAWKVLNLFEEGQDTFTR